MRVVQIIDSLEAGGAERMAVNYANALACEIEFSGLVVTRKEGPLLGQINDKVHYLFLNKKRTIDLKAIFQLRKFVIKNKIEIIHAHSTSFFISFLLKMTYPRVKLIWHDHYGNSEFLSERPFLGLRLMSSCFEGIITVNQKLKLWSENRLHFKNVIYMPNFPSKEMLVSEPTFLKGISGKRIVCLANLRVQKNHFMLLEVARKTRSSYPDWTFHLVGKDFEDHYSYEISNFISNFQLEDKVFLYGSKQDVGNILDQSTIALLTSKSEGLPVALLEYGWHKKAVVVTKVGEIPLVIQNGINGFLVESDDLDLFYTNLVQLIENDTLRFDFANALHKTITQDYSEKSLIIQYLKWLEHSLK
jgi:glycosyltransferase involved in cell wall biosynthesis